MSIENKELPTTTETIDSETGIKTITSWKWNENSQLIKVIRKVELIPVKRVVLKRVAERAAIVPFGIPKGANNGVTMQSVDDINMEKTGQMEKPSDNSKPASTGGITCRYCKGNHYSAKCPHKDIMLQQEKDAPKEEASTPQLPGKGKYVPPSLRRGDGKISEFSEEDDGISLRISNIPEDIDEYMLRDMFHECGDLRRLHVIHDFVTKKSRGFAFASYPTKEEAEAAIARYNGYALNHLIMSVTIAEKRKASTNAPRYNTGYGKALPQNTRR